MLNQFFKKSELETIQSQALEFQPLASSKTLNRAERNKWIVRNLDRQDLFLFNYGPLALGLMSVFSNSYIFYQYRRLFRVRKAGFFFYMIPVFSGLGTGIIYNALIQTPLVYQRINCFNCAFVKAQVNQLFHGVVFPVVAASTMSLFIALTSSTIQLPHQVYQNATNVRFLAKYLLSTTAKQNQLLNMLGVLALANFCLCLYVLNEQQNEVAQLAKVIDHKFDDESEAL